ncbi:hypothetical protein AB0J38_41080 [Streptomyces sp. NPDC050095]|uniref:hypothetical protein n=1 Tax=unclassified Streptomyces TaxID=2593676 RepID=UPI00343BBF3D
MSRKYPKKVRKEFKRKLAAAEAFVEAWTNSGLASTLITDYTCTLMCEEAKTFAGLMRSFGYHNTAAQIIADHCEDCDDLEYHFTTDVWTVDVEVQTFNPDLKAAAEDFAWTLVLNAERPNEARGKAEAAVTDHMKGQGLLKPGMFVTATDVRSGFPASTALYSWTDLREVESAA